MLAPRVRVEGSARCAHGTTGERVSLPISDKLEEDLVVDILRAHTPRKEKNHCDTFRNLHGKMRLAESTARGARDHAIDEGGLPVGFAPGPCAWCW